MLMCLRTVVEIGFICKWLQSRLAVESWILISRAPSHTVDPLTAIINDLSILRGRVDDLSFFDYLSSFCFLLIEFHCSFSISYKILPDYVYYYCISIRMWYAVGTSFIRAPCTVLLFHSCCPMRECLWKHSCTSSPFSIAILNGTSSFLSLVQENINMPSGHYYRLCSWSGR